MLEVKNISFQYKGKKNQETFGLQDISFQLEKGYILGLLGLNGAGKSTLMNLLMGVHIPDSGNVVYDGMEVSEDTTKSLQKIALVSDKMEFLRFRTLRENVSLFGLLYENFDYEKWDKYMISFGFGADQLGLCYDDLSTGEKRKFQLAFALSYSPELLLLDEPTANLDPHARVEWMELVGKQVAEEEISVIMATHLTSDLDELADYILVLDQGKQIAYMDREEMVDNFGEIELSKLLLELTGDTWIKE